jgi:hypothetical protein
MPGDYYKLIGAPSPAFVAFVVVRACSCAARQHSYREPPAPDSIRFNLPVGSAK